MRVADAGHCSPRTRHAAIDWPHTPAFAMAHDGPSAGYRVLAWRGNDDECLVTVAMQHAEGWIGDMTRYSFCRWDIDVRWHGRNAFVGRLYGAMPRLAACRASRIGVAA